MTVLSSCSNSKFYCLQLSFIGFSKTLHSVPIGYNFVTTRLPGQKLPVCMLSWDWLAFIVCISISWPLSAFFTDFYFFSFNGKG